MSEAQVQAEATQGAQARGQPVDLHVPVHRLPAQAAGRPAQVVEAVGQFGDRLLEALAEGREVLLVAADQRRVGLGGETAGKVERARGQGVHAISSDPGRRSRSPAAHNRTPAPGPRDRDASPVDGSTSPHDSSTDKSPRT